MHFNADSVNIIYFMTAMPKSATTPYIMIGYVVHVVIVHISVWKRMSLALFVVTVRS